MIVSKKEGSMHTEAHGLQSEVQTIVILSTRTPDMLLISLIDLVLPHSATSQMIKAVRVLDLKKKKENMHGPRTTRNRSRNWTVFFIQSIPYGINL